MKKVLMILLTLAMVFSMAGVVSAENSITTDGGTGDVVVSHDIADSFVVTLPSNVAFTESNLKSEQAITASGVLIPSKNILRVTVDSGTDGFKLTNGTGLSVSEILYTVTANGNEINENNKIVLEVTEGVGSASSSIIFETTLENIKKATLSGKHTDMLTFTVGIENDPTANSVLKIGTAEQLRKFAEFVNAGKSDTAGTKYSTMDVVLTHDIDLEGEEWTPIGQTGSSYGAVDYFKGTFDGQGYTISNLTITKTNAGANYATGLFGFIDASSATIKNVKIDNAEIHGHHWVGAIAGYMTGTIDNCEVTNSVIIATNANNDANGDKVGGIVGFLNTNGAKTITNNKVSNSYIVGNRDVGGILGGVFAYDSTKQDLTIVFTGNSVMDVSIIHQTNHVGEILGRPNGHTIDTTTSNTAENVVIETVNAIVSTVDELKTALENSATVIFLEPGTYNIPATAKGKTLTLIGTKDTVIEVIPAGQGEGNGQLDYNLDGSTVTFKGVTIKTNNQTYAGYARLTGTYEGCTFDNCYCLNGYSEFNNCEFNVEGNQYNLWTWGAPSAEFTDCTFNSDGKALLLYGGTNTKLTLTGCTFNDNGGLADKKAAVEIGNDYDKSYELIINNCVVNGYEINDKGINTGTTLWANKDSMSTDKLNVVVDGIDVY